MLALMQFNKCSQLQQHEPGQYLVLAWAGGPAPGAVVGAAVVVGEGAVGLAAPHQQSVLSPCQEDI